MVTVTVWLLLQAPSLCFSRENTCSNRWRVSFRPWNSIDFPAKATVGAALECLRVDPSIVSGFRFLIDCSFPRAGISTVLLATRSHPQKTNGPRFSVSQMKVFLKFSYFLLTFESHGTLLTKTIDLPTADLSWLAQKPYPSNSHFSFSPFNHPHTQSLPCHLDLDGPSLKALWISFRTRLKISRDKVQL